MFLDVAKGSQLGVFGFSEVNLDVLVSTETIKSGVLGVNNLSYKLLPGGHDVDGCYPLDCEPKPSDVWHFSTEASSLE